MKEKKAIMKGDRHYIMEITYEQSSSERMTIRVMNNETATMYNNKK